MTDLLSENFFSPDYQTARKRFQDAVARTGGTLSTLPVQSDDAGNQLATEIAWFGSLQPKKALIVISGIHGVEGFAGSAIQLATLNRLPEIPEHAALVMVHVLNPYGMAQLRRFNANNVDLNRNFHFLEDGWEGVPKGYALLDSFLNPRHPPSQDFFQLKLLLAQLSLGERAIKRVVASGQYRYPEGLFYGGSGLEVEAVNYIEWLEGSALLKAEKLTVIDIHTGLGDFGEQSIFLRSESVSKEVLSGKLGVQVAPDEKESKVMGYDHGGGSSGVYRHLFSGEELNCLTVEYGTYAGRRLLYALRAENQQHFYGDKDLHHWAKQKNKEAFCPKSESWRKKVAEQGLDLVNKAIVALL